MDLREKGVHWYWSASEGEAIDSFGVQLRGSPRGAMRAAGSAS